MKYLFVIASCLLLSACAQTGRYSQKQDSAPHYIPSRITTQDAIPRYEPYNPVNSRPYVVLGKKYWPMSKAKGYTATGHASWYGQKFHGHLTSNGERYNMYSMSAAHKTLPLPSFVRVTNLRNNRQVVVRVNDRGPFHGGRVIDLSYAAASKLDMLKTGTAPVKLEVIHVDENGATHIAGQPKLIAASPRAVSVAPPPTAPQQKDQALFVQVTAISDGEKVKQLASGLGLLYQVETRTPKNNGVYRLHLGPMDDHQHADEVLQQLRNDGYQRAFKLVSPD